MGCRFNVLIVDVGASLAVERGVQCRASRPSLVELNAEIRDGFREFSSFKQASKQRLSNG